MPKTVSLTTVKGGINRLRTKGAALQDSLYDLLNGYVTASRTVKVRPGTLLHATLPAGTKGLCAADGVLNVFAPDVPEGMPEGITCHVVRHPSNFPAAEVDAPERFQIEEVHFAAKFMGFIYAAVEFEADPDDTITPSTHHFWLQTGDTWEAEKVYAAGDIVRPTEENGLYYQARRVAGAFPVWTPGMQVEVGDVVEPTVPNGFCYIVTEVFGDNPQTGTVEPTWPTEVLAEIPEDTESQFDGLVGPAVQADPDAKPSPDIQERYE